MADKALETVREGCLGGPTVAPSKAPGTNVSGLKVDGGMGRSDPNFQPLLAPCLVLGADRATTALRDSLSLAPSE
jgi:hypothetical protein